MSDKLHAKGRNSGVYTPECWADNHKCRLEPDECWCYCHRGPMVSMERKTEYVATETHRYTFRCSCGYLSDPLINLHDAQQVLKMHQAHEGSQELTVYAVGQPSYR